MITIRQAQESCGTLSNPSKMPGKGTSTPAWHCITGSKLRDVPGSVCEGCYAMKGQYIIGSTPIAMENRWDKVMDSETNPWPWINGMVKLIWNQEYFRWDDSGDIQGVFHLENICQVAKRTPHVKHWLPTREYRMAVECKLDIPENLVVRLSAHMVDGAPPTNLGFPTSTVVTDGSHDCPASLQDGACSGINEKTGDWNDCRKCWDTSNQNTAYPKH